MQKRVAVWRRGVEHSMHEIPHTWKSGHGEVRLPRLGYVQICHAVLREDRVEKLRQWPAPPVARMQ